MTDIAVIGSGPSGLSAAVTAAVRNKSVTVLGEDISKNPLYKAEKVNNYLGLPGITGKELLEAFHGHAESAGVGIGEGKVTQIMPMGEHFLVNCNNMFIEAKTVIIATGIPSSKAIKGESEFLGKGVSYCATCDGMLYRGKSVIVVGETPEAENEAVFLSEICAKVRYMPLYSGAVKEFDGVIAMDGEKPVEIRGGRFVTSLLTENGETECDGVFLIKKTLPVSSLLYGLETENGAIKTNRNSETNVGGVFACGDCTGKPYQIGKAAGEGTTAALQACKYLGG